MRMFPRLTGAAGTPGTTDATPTATVAGTPATNHARPAGSVAMAAALPRIRNQGAAQATSGIFHASGGMTAAVAGVAAGMSGRFLLPIAHAVPALPMAHVVAVLPAAGEMHGLPVAQQVQDDLPTAHALLPRHYAPPVLERQVGSINLLATAAFSGGEPDLVERPPLHRDTSVVRLSHFDEVRRSDTDPGGPTR